MGKDINNVIFITIDALRADHLAFIGYNRDTSPFLGKVAEEGITFTLAFSNSSHTFGSFPSIFSSDYPVLGSSYTIEGRTVFQEILKEKGYQTAAFNSNPYLSRYYKYDRGFNYFEDYLRSISPENKNPPQTKTSMKRQIAGKLIREHDIFFNIFALLRTIANLERKNLPYVNALDLTNDVLSWIENQSKKPFFLWVHYMDIHSPPVYPRVLNDIEGPPVNKHELKERLHKMNSSEKTCLNYLADLLNKYDYRIRFVDHAIEALFSRLDNGILDSSLIIVTADHGEEFFDHGHLGHRPKLYDELIHVPLLIKGPGIPHGTKVDEIVQHLDIAPTILDLLDIPIPRCFLGENVFEVTGREGVISETSSELNRIEIDLSKLKVAYRTKDWKYIYCEDADDELYNLKIDPKETKNLLSEQKEKAEEFKSKILKHIAMKEKTFIISNEKKKIKGLKRSGRI